MATKELKLNSVENLELPIIASLNKNGEVIAFRLSKELTPIAFNNKVEELLEEGACETREEAEKYVSSMAFDMEIYYQKGCGLFAVEQGAVESGTVYSPYTADLYEDSIE